jgi:hypothetical protein
MKKRIKLEVEVTLDESVEQQVIHVARKHYCEVGQATEPLDDKGQHWRDVPAEEFIPDVEAAIMELIGANALLEEAGVEVTAVSGPEPQREQFRSQEASEPVLQDDASQAGQARGSSEEELNEEAELDEFETGVYRVDGRTATFP